MALTDVFTAGDLPPLDWLEVIRPGVCLGRVRHAVFDFDGTISVIRRGWEQIMIPMMVEMICGPDHAPSPEIEAKVADYVDRSTGILTIKQMQWLAEAVRCCGMVREPKTARDYKQMYNERLLGPVRQRLQQVVDSQAARETLMITGAWAFLRGLQARGVMLYLASGTDHPYVLEEAEALGVRALFGARIYGARDDTEAYTKARIIQRILDTHELHGDELVVVGDGPVEIRHARARGAIALGVAADEDQRGGLNPRKRRRLLDAGADLIVTDFRHHRDLLRFLCGEV